MKAVKWNKYGGPNVLSITDMPVPEIKDNEMLVKVMATTVTAGDCEIRGLKFPFMFKWAIRLYFGLFKPRNKVLGQEMAGTVVALGNKVESYKVGDDIIAALGLTLGGYAEYVVIKEKPAMGAHYYKPTNLSFNEATTIPVGGFEAMHFIEQTQLKEGQKVLINGAGGSIGSIAIQLAKMKNAHVTAVDCNDKLDLLRSLSADEVINYEDTNFTDQAEYYDVIFDIVGKAPIEESYESLSPTGIYMIGNPSSKHKRFAKEKNGYDKQVICTTSPQRQKDLITLVKLFEEGSLKTTIDQVMPLDDIVKAHRYVEENRKKGNLVIQVSNEDEEVSI